MNGRDRYFGMLRGTTIDYVPRIPIVMQFAADYIGSDYAALAGNIDPVSGVLRGTPDSIRRDIRTVYEQAGNPYMVCAGCEIPCTTPPDNLRALCQPMAPLGHGKPKESR